MKIPSMENGFQRRQADLICLSYEKLLNETLLKHIRPDESGAEALFYAPFAVLSHTTDADPLFNYANLKALELFEFDWDEMIGMPSRYSAGENTQAERDRLLKEVGRHGFIRHYQGVRLTKSRRKFLIQDSVVWNLIDDQGGYAGQAACLNAWKFI